MLTSIKENWSGYINTGKNRLRTKNFVRDKE